MERSEIRDELEYFLPHSASLYAGYSFAHRTIGDTYKNRASSPSNKSRALFDTGKP
jgi:hypothetical protein